MRIFDESCVVSLNKLFNERRGSSDCDGQLCDVTGMDCADREILIGFISVSMVPLCGDVLGSFAAQLLSNVKRTWLFLVTH